MAATSPTRNADLGETLNSLVKWAWLGFMVLLIGIPLLIVVSASFTGKQAMFAGKPFLLPKDPTLEYWTESISGLVQPLLNSFLASLGSVILSLLIAVPGGYAFARTEFRYKEWLFYLVILALLFPIIILVMPIVDVFVGLGLFNNLPGLWISYQLMAAPFAIWILRDYFEGLPANLEEAAQVYGCTQFTAFRRVMLPLSLPGVVAVGFISFMIAWNEFLYTNMLTTGQGPRTAVVHLFVQTMGGERVLWGWLMTQAIIIGIPPAILYIFARRYLSNAFAF